MVVRDRTGMKWNDGWWLGGSVNNECGILVDDAFGMMVGSLLRRREERLTLVSIVNVCCVFVLERKKERLR